MLAMSKIVQESRDYDSWTNLVKIKFLRLQAYLVSIEKHCKHIKSVLELRMKAYVVLFGIKIASIFVPRHKNIASICSPSLYQH